MVIHTQERRLHQTQEIQYREFQNSSLEELRECMNKMVRSDKDLRAELLQTQKLVQNSMTEDLG